MSARSSARMLKKARNLATVIIAAGAMVAAAACGDDEHVEALGSGGGTTAAATVTSTAEAAVSSASSSGSGGDDPGTPIRSISSRDPFGNVAETKNLLWDGDFEWESAFSDQYGWLQGQTANVTARRVGPECRSGLKCGVLGPDLIGIAVSSAEHDLYASIWARPSDGSCESVSVYLLAEGIYDDAEDADVPPVADAADETGWCHYELVAPQRNDKAYLQVTTTSIEDVLVDDAVVREATTGESVRVARRSIGPFGPQAFEKIEAARALIRKWRGPHEGAPNPTRDALERWGRGEGRARFVASPQVKGRGSR